MAMVAHCTAKSAELAPSRAGRVRQRVLLDIHRRRFPWSRDWDRHDRIAGCLQLPTMRVEARLLALYALQLGDLEPRPQLRLGPVGRRGKLPQSASKIFRTRAGPERRARGHLLGGGAGTISTIVLLLSLDGGVLRACRAARGQQGDELAAERRDCVLRRGGGDMEAVPDELDRHPLAISLDEALARGHVYREA